MASKQPTINMTHGFKNAPATLTLVSKLKCHLIVTIVIWFNYVKSFYGNVLKTITFIVLIVGVTSQNKSYIISFIKTFQLHFLILKMISAESVPHYGEYFKVNSTKLQFNSSQNENSGQCL